MVLNRGKWHASQPGRFTSQGKDLDNPLDKGWVDLRASLNAVKNRKIFAPARIKS